MVGTGELVVIMSLALLLFGGKKLPELARSLGLGIREFKKACQEDEPCDVNVKEQCLSETKNTNKDSFITKSNSEPKQLTPSQSSLDLE